MQPTASESMLTLCSRWIQFLCLVLIAYGVAMVFAPQMMNSMLVGSLLFHSESLQTAFERVSGTDPVFFNVLNGLIGAVTIGYAISIGWIAREPFRRGESWAWNAIAASITAWAIFESYVKLASGLGVWSQAHFSLLAAIGIPLLVTYRRFHRRQADIEPQQPQQLEEPRQLEPARSDD
jgi:hypothetical protein